VELRSARPPTPNWTQALVVKKANTRSGHEAAFDRLVELIRSVFPPDGDVHSITVATPGPVDPQTGVIASAPNIPGWDNYPLRNKLEAAFHIPTNLGNDANLAALGEWKFGAGQGHAHLLYLTISTGIGAASL
jgi:glucokinase